MASKENRGMLFIPDISGFSKFVSETEISHSQHIIEELLEIIIDNNPEKFVVSEVEGDAVLFYKNGHSVPFDKMLSQIKSVFVKFHTHIRRFETDRICECGACSTAQDLSIKFVVHYGEIAQMKVKSREKLLGKDVILAHRLLKNDVEGHEYVLMTNDYMESLHEDFKRSNEDWIDLKNSVESYDEFDNVEISSFSLSPLLTKIIEEKREEEVINYKHKFIHQIEIDAPFKYVHSIVTDLDLKPKWTVGLKGVKSLNHKVARIGTIHECIIPVGQVQLETTFNEVGDDYSEYHEKSVKQSFLKHSHLKIRIDKIEDEKSLIIFETNYVLKPFIGFFVHPFLKLALPKNFKESAIALKNLVEEKYKAKVLPNFVIGAAE